MPKQYRIVFHAGARQDLLEVVEYIRDKEKNPINARRFNDLVEAEAERLHTFPDAYRQVADGPPRPVHAVVVRGAPNHVLYYDVFEEENAVRVLFVWDGRRRSGPDVSSRRFDPLRQ